MINFIFRKIKNIYNASSLFTDIYNVLCVKEKIGKMFFDFIFLYRFVSSVCVMNKKCTLA